MYLLCIIFVLIEDKYKYADRMDNLTECEDYFLVFNHIFG